MVSYLVMCIGKVIGIKLLKNKGGRNFLLNIILFLINVLKKIISFIFNILLFLIQFLKNKNNNNFR